MEICLSAQASLGLRSRGSPEGLKPKQTDITAATAGLVLGLYCTKVFGLSYWDMISGSHITQGVLTFDKPLIQIDPPVSLRSYLIRDAV